MQVILMENVTNLGNLGEIVNVKNGYARNFLIPRNIAKRATKDAIKEFELKRSELEKIENDKLKDANLISSKILNLKLVIKQKSGVDGKLFGSVTNLDILEAFSKHEILLNKSQIQMPNGYLKTLGEHKIFIVLHTDITTEVKVSVESE